LFRYNRLLGKFLLWYRRGSRREYSEANIWWS